MPKKHKSLPPPEPVGATDSEDSDPESSDDESGSESEDEHQTGDFVPEIEWPATVISIGKKFSGKTNLLLDMVDPKDFDNVYVFTKSKHTGNLDSLVPDKRAIFTQCSERLLNDILERAEQSYLKSKQGKKRSRPEETLLVWDDFQGMFNMSSSKAMTVLAASGRNFGISMWVSSQDRVGIATMIRRNAEYWFLGNNTVKVINDLADEMAMANMGKKRMKEILSKISRDKDHEFLFLDDRNQTDTVYKAPQVM